MEIAWAAGLFDGEGTVLINANATHGGPKRYSAGLKVDLLHEGTVKELERILGGYTESYMRKSGGKRVWRWRCGGAATRNVVEALKPYAVTKAAELAILARFLDTKPYGVYTPSQRAACASLKEELEAVRCYTKRAASSSRP